ncbi:hypothetical protein AKJ57_00235 [candidate division MSBL1 archaeon SCGC-AAA259A05]|uniref:Uncharacterized protein n=1 Tax=candidate division MSBL1 archaeon SCGC-AAA259A05 TaxID=1698259 RepID=A0A133UC47_9EURY|nr:hypothetical protein AKJ57_00235 [candidate division MSBL1 archaeon SCGC-AAA259A05]
MTIPQWVPIGIVVLGIFTWAALHEELEKRQVTVSPSVIFFLEMVPSFAFSAMVFIFLIPSLFYFVYGKLPEWALGGLFLRLTTFLGAVMLL